MSSEPLQSLSVTASHAGMTPACPVCGAADPPRRTGIADAGVFECRHCGLVFVWPRPAPQSLSASEQSVQTSEAYTAGMLDLAAADRHRARIERMARRRHNVYRELLKKDRYALLEIGCGAATLGPHYVALGVQYDGIDIDPRVISAVQKRHGAALRVQCKDFYDVPPDQRFDVICCSQVLEHIVHPPEFAKKASDHLTPTGVLQCDVPNHNALAGVLSRWGLRRGGGLRWGAIEYPHHLFGYRVRTLYHLLSTHFNVKAFQANATDPCWGQPLAEGCGLATRVYWMLSGLLRMQSLAVAVGQKRGGL